MRLAPRRKQTGFGVGARPKPEPGEKIFVIVEGRGSFELCPIKTDGLVREAPRTDHLKGLFKKRVGCPQQQYAVVRRPFRHGQRLDVGERHTVVIGLGAAALALVRIGGKGPRRVGVNHLVALGLRRGTHSASPSYSGASIAHARGRRPGGQSPFIGTSTLLAGVLLGRFFGRDPVVALEPAAEIDPGAANRAEWPMLRRRRLAADRARA